MRMPFRLRLVDKSFVFVFSMILFIISRSHDLISPQLGAVCPSDVFIDFVRISDFVFTLSFFLFIVPLLFPLFWSVTQSSSHNFSRATIDLAYATLEPLSSASSAFFVFVFPLKSFRFPLFISCSFLSSFRCPLSVV